MMASISVSRSMPGNAVSSPWARAAVAGAARKAASDSVLTVALSQAAAGNLRTFTSPLRS